jgi:Mor family transcriptional regulator
VARNARNRRIHKEFTGANHRDLADRYNLTVAHVHNILRDMRAKSRGRAEDRQMDLF